MLRDPGRDCSLIVGKLEIIHFPDISTTACAAGASAHQFVGRVETLFDMPNNRLDLLWRFCSKAMAGCPSEPARTNFAALTDQEGETMEKMFCKAVAGGSEAES